MKKLPSSLTNMVLVLTGVTIIMGAILAYVNHLTSGPIEQQKQLALDEGIKAVLASSNVTVSSTDTIHTSDAKGKTLIFIVYHTEKGTAVESMTMGFGGPLKVLVGFSPEGKILGYTLLEHQETPGLGTKAGQWFQRGQKGDIIGRDPADGLTVAKDGGDVDAITASTITSRAFLLAITNAYNAIKKNEN